MTEVPVFHVWTRGGGLDRRFRRRGHCANRTNSGALVCGIAPAPGLNTIGRASGDALARHTRDGVGPKSYRICPDCMAGILAAKVTKSKSAI